MPAKLKMLIAYPAMMIGGSTTSLLSILSLLDYGRYDVDLLLNRNTGELLDKLPPQVRLLPPALKYPGRRSGLLRRLLSPRYLWVYWQSRRISRRSGVAIHGPQYLEMKDVEFFREIPDEYDVAVAFLEGDRCKFVARHVNAKRKIAWIHVNYRDSGFDPDYDRSTMAAFDRIVLVSDDCKRAFDEAFPELRERTCVIENILSAEVIRARAAEVCDYQVPQNRINLVTTCRINFRSKGLDRVISAWSRLSREGVRGLRWHIIGDGCDMPKLRDMIDSAGLQDDIHLLGMQTNPYKFMRAMDLFFLPSRWEGKPMAVTEAFMLGLPALVTEYSSAREQVRDGIDGMILENSEEGIYRGLRFIAEHREDIGKWRSNVLACDYSNLPEMKKVEEILE